MTPTCMITLQKINCSTDGSREKFGVVSCFVFMWSDLAINHIYAVVNLRVIFVLPLVDEGHGYRCCRMARICLELKESNITVVQYRMSWMQFSVLCLYSATEVIIVAGCLQLWKHWKYVVNWSSWTFLSKGMIIMISSHKELSPILFGLIYQ